MKTFVRCAAQGDVLIRRIDELPMGLTEQAPIDNVHVVAHSETGHHHVISAKHARYFVVNAFVAYLIIEKEAALLRHMRDFDRHEDVSVEPGIYELRRKREYTSEGFRRVED